MFDSIKRHFRVMLLIFLVIGLLAYFASFQYALNKREQTELVDLQQGFDGNNPFGITYDFHFNNQVHLGMFSGRGIFIPREEQASIKLFTQTFANLDSGDLSPAEDLKNQEEQDRQKSLMKTFILDSICNSLILGNFKKTDSMIVVDLVAKSSDSSKFESQIMNLRITQARCNSDY